MTKARDLANSADVFDTVSTTELGYLDGVSSAIQTQIDSKVASSLVDAKGDLLVGSADNTVSRLAVGTNNYVLTADSAEATGLKWAAAGSGFVGCSIYKSSAQLISTGTSTAVSFNAENFDTDSFHDNSTNNSRITIPSGKAGKYLFVFRTAWDNANTGQRAVRYRLNGVATDYIVQNVSNDLDIGIYNNGSVILDLTVGDYIEMYVLHSRTGDSLWLNNAFIHCQYLGA